MIEIKDEGSSFKEGRRKKSLPVYDRFYRVLRSKKRKVECSSSRILINNVNLILYSSTLFRLPNRRIRKKERKFRIETENEKFLSRNESSRWTEKRRKMRWSKRIVSSKLKGLINQPASSRQLFSLVNSRGGVENRFLSVSTRWEPTCSTWIDVIDKFNDNNR